MEEDDSDYEIVSHREIAELKKELTDMKGGDSQLSFHASIDNLQLNISTLIDIFREASKGMKSEEDHQAELLKKIDTTLERLDAVLEQNEKIAEGIVAVADMVKELKDYRGSISEKPSFASPPRPQAPMPGMMPGTMQRSFPPIPPPPPFPSQMSVSPFPPPKKGLF